MTSRVFETSVKLVQRIRTGEKAAWRRHRTHYAPLVRYWCRRSGVDGGDLDDLFPEIWLAVGPRLSFYRPGPGGSFRAWLRGIARRKAQHWHRRRVRQPAEDEGGSAAGRRLERAEAAPGEDSEPYDPGEGAACRALHRRLLAMVRDQFEDRPRSAFGAVEVEDRPAAEVGDQLGMSAAAVRMAKYRVLSKIRPELGESID